MRKQLLPTIRKANRQDLESILDILVDDMFGVMRDTSERPLLKSYYDAFDVINNDPNATLMVAELGGKVVGTIQLNVLTFLSNKGARSALVENVFVSSNMRGKGIGAAMMCWAIAHAKEQGCLSMQLTSSKVRKDAHRFYERLGFKCSHEGIKLSLI